jgi:hypothetical protein
VAPAEGETLARPKGPSKREEDDVRRKKRPSRKKRIWLERKRCAERRKSRLRIEWQGTEWYYNVYLKSPHWLLLRQKYLESKGYPKTCSMCAVEGPVDVHHKTYEHLGREQLSELIHLCRRCHKVIHAILKVGRTRGGVDHDFAAARLKAVLRAKVAEGKTLDGAMLEISRVLGKYADRISKDWKGRKPWVKPDKWNGQWRRNKW